MAQIKNIIQNKGSRPDNIVFDEAMIKRECRQLESKMPSFLFDFFLFLNTAVAISTRFAYLQDIKKFLEFFSKNKLCDFPDDIKSISVSDFNKVTARDVNRYISSHLASYEIEENGVRKIIENSNPSLSRNKSSMASMFKYLFRESILKEDISAGFNPIRIPKRSPDAIKRLSIDELKELILIVDTGKGLSKKELEYWNLTKLRDMAIIIMFTTYGLRLNELYSLNLSSIHFDKKEITVYRKRGKVAIMPINQSTEFALRNYISTEREIYSNESEDALFLSMQNKRLTERAIRNLVKKYTAIATKSSKRTAYSPHKLRATTASVLIEFGFSIFDVQNLLDHDHVSTTQLYAQHKKNSKIEIIENYELLSEDDSKFRSDFKFDENQDKIAKEKVFDINKDLLENEKI